MTNGWGHTVTHSHWGHAGAHLTRGLDDGWAGLLSPSAVPLDPADASLALRG